MKKVKIIYVYDANCVWCFGFSPTMAKLQTHYQDKVEFEVISGGLILGSGVGANSKYVFAQYDTKLFKVVEYTCGVKFGNSFVNGALKKGTMILNSIPPAIALCIMKEKHPDKSIEFAGLLHKMYFVDGIEPENYETYGAYASTLGYDKTEFNQKMKDSTYVKKAFKDFEYAQHLGVNSFPKVLLEKEGKIEILFNVIKTFDAAKKIIDSKL